MRGIINARDNRAAPLDDGAYVADLIRQGSSERGLASARAKAKAALREYPKNGCAAHLSALLQMAGIAVPMTAGAGKLAALLELRGWRRIPRGQQQPGDVGVTFDNDPTPPGEDHVYLVIETMCADRMLIADNQNGKDEPHERSVPGGRKTPTEYFLRAPGA